MWYHSWGQVNATIKLTAVIYVQADRYPKMWPSQYTGAPSKILWPTGATAARQVASEATHCSFMAKSVRPRHSRGRERCDP